MFDQGQSFLFRHLHFILLGCNSYRKKLPKPIHACKQNHLRTPRQMYAMLMYITFQRIFMLSVELGKLLILVATFISLKIWRSITYYILASPQLKPQLPFYISWLTEILASQFLCPICVLPFCCQTSYLLI